MISESISFLLSASIVFVGSHILLSHPMRPLLSNWLGEKGFAIAYSLIALISLGWMVHAFRAAPIAPFVWDGWNAANWLTTSALTILALIFILGGMVRNPAMPHPEARGAVCSREITGIFAVTRHPMMWGVALWAAGHVIVAPNARTIVFAGSLAVLALACAALQDRKKAQLLGKDWLAWQARTSYWPRVRNLSEIGVKLWAGAIALWLALSWLHLYLASIPAGVWRWLI